jgi:hypothetical protein
MLVSGSVTPCGRPGRSVELRLTCGVVEVPNGIDADNRNRQFVFVFDTCVEAGTDFGGGLRLLLLIAVTDSPSDSITAESGNATCNMQLRVRNRRHEEQCHEKCKKFFHSVCWFRLLKIAVCDGMLSY